MVTTEVERLVGSDTWPVSYHTFSGSSLNFSYIESDHVFAAAQVPWTHFGLVSMK